MNWLIILAAILALVAARPEKYKEQEDFQYSRSSSDEGSKSGYYGAQRGNMGGNYERAHNMDALAQNQMSGLVRQVEGDLGEGAKTRSGNVFTAGSSKGIYGSGRFDTSNLHGRNFQEGISYDNSNLHSSLTHSSSAHSATGFANTNSHSHGGYRRTASDTQTQAHDLQSLDSLQTSNQHTYGSTRRSSGYESQAGFQEQKYYDGDSTNSHSGYGSNVYTRLTTPVRIVVTPGGRVALPVAVQTYDTMHGSVLNHNALDSEVATTSDINQGSVYRPKYYESSYKYNKKWEKHDIVPSSGSDVILTETTIPKNSELYEDVDVHKSGHQNNAREMEFQSAHANSASERFNAAKSSRQFGYNSNYNSQYLGGASNLNSDAYSHTGYKAQQDHSISSDSLNAYTQAQRNSGSRYSGISTDSGLNAQARYNAGSQLDLSSQAEDLNTRPKSYHSSYSYHKSWERQGDPYVIKPASNSYSDSQTSQRLISSTKNLGYATYQPNSQYNQRLCEENCHLRVARSYGTDHQNMEQQSQSLHDNQDQSQQVQGTWKNLEDLGQQTQTGWDQQTDGQQSLSQWDNLKDLSQQSQGNWDQQNFGQQSQDQWDNLKDLSQQSQGNWDQQNVPQQSQNNWDNLKDLNQQSQNNKKPENVEQQSQNHWDNLEDLGQPSQSNWNQQNVEQQKVQNQGYNLENLSQQSQSNWDQIEDGQQTQNQESNFDNLGQVSQNNWDQPNVGQQSNINWDKIEKLNQQSLKDIEQQNFEQNTRDNFQEIRHDGRKPEDSDIFGQHARNFLEQQNQETKHELSYKSENDLYAQYALTPEVIQKDINLEHTQQEKKIDILWDKFDNIDSNKRKVVFDKIKNNTESDIEFKTLVNEDVHQKTTNLYSDDDILSPKESHSYKDNFNDNSDNMAHQKESNDNSEYSYSSGFVNPFFNQYHKKQLSQYDNTFSENSGAFESPGIWNSHVHSYSNTQDHLQNVNNSHSYIQGTPITSLWSKFDKIETESVLSTHVNTDSFLTKNQTESNFTSLFANQNNTISINQPWYVPDPHQIETTTVETIESPEHKDHQNTLNDTIAPKDLQPLQDEKPETPQDIGRGDIGPEEILDINESNKPYKNPTRHVSQNIFDTPAKQDNVKPKIVHNAYIEKGQLDNQLTVLSIQQQNDKNKILLPNKNDTTNNTLHTILQHNEKIDTKYNKDFGNRKNNETGNINVLNQSHILNQTNFFEAQTETKTDENLNHKNYSRNHLDQDIELQSNINVEQETVNMEQDSLYNFGQEDLQDFTQQNVNVDNPYLHNFQDTLQSYGRDNENLNQQNLHNFGQEDENKNTEQYILGEDLQKQNINHSQHNSYLHREKNLQYTENLPENLAQKNLIRKSNATADINNPETYFLNHHNEEVPQINLPRIQKSIGSLDGESSLNNNRDDLLHVQQHVQDLGEHIPHYQFEQNYGSINSFEQDFDKGFEQQYQASIGELNNLEQQSVKLADINQNTQKTLTKNSQTTSTQKAIISSQYSQKPEKVTEKPGFWKSVGNKISSAKDKVVSWFRS